jgi:hypothetical protein
MLNFYFSFDKKFEKWYIIRSKVLETIVIIYKTFTRLGRHSLNVQEAFDTKVKTLDIMDSSNPSQFGA